MTKPSVVAAVGVALAIFGAAAGAQTSTTPSRTPGGVAPSRPITGSTPALREAPKFAAALNPTATAASEFSIALTWPAVADADRYRILRSVSATGPFVVAGQTPAPNTSFTDTDLVPRTTFFYRIEPMRDGRAGPAFTNIMVTGRTAEPPPIAWKVSCSNDGSSGGNASCTWTWTLPPRVAALRLYGRSRTSALSSACHMEGDGVITQQTSLQRSFSRGSDCGGAFLVAVYKMIDAPDYGATLEARSLSVEMKPPWQ